MKRFKDLGIGDNIFEISGHNVYVNTINSIKIDSYGITFECYDYTNCEVEIDIQYPDKSKEYYDDDWVCADYYSLMEVLNKKIEKIEKLKKEYEKYKPRKDKIKEFLDVQDQKDL